MTLFSQFAKERNDPSRGRSYTNKSNETAVPMTRNASARQRKRINRWWNQLPFVRSVVLGAMMAPPLIMPARARARDPLLRAIVCVFFVVFTSSFYRVGGNCIFDAGLSKSGSHRAVAPRTRRRRYDCSHTRPDTLIAGSGRGSTIDDTGPDSRGIASGDARLLRVPVRLPFSLYFDGRPRASAPRHSSRSCVRHCTSISDEN